MRTSVPVLATLLALSACGQAAHEGHNAAGNATAPIAAAAASRPTVRLPAVPGRPAAGYFELRVSGDRGALLSVTSPQAGRIELHETMTRGTMTSMRPIERLAVRDGETLSFRPGGRHLMLFDIDRGVAAGGRIELVLRFERGDPVTLAAELVPTGGDVGP